MTTRKVLGQVETIGMLLDRSQRPTRTVPIRNTFVQQGAQRSPKPGPLATLVKHRDDRALGLFLIALAVASGGDHSVTEWATTWARTFGVFKETPGRAAVSRAWNRLEKLKLIKRQRAELGKTRVTLLREDGSGNEYRHAHRSSERYFQLPFEYWTSDERWHDTLTLPAKSVLLIALSFRSVEFALPQDQVPKWYGISADTAGRGLSELREQGIIQKSREEYVPSLRSPTGYAPKNWYRLMEPFDLAPGPLARRKKAAGSKAKS